MGNVEVKLDCRRCGFCCVSGFALAWANVEEAEEKELLRHIHQDDLYVIPPIASWDIETVAIKTKWTLQKKGPLKGKRLHVCRFLKGFVGDSVRCSIYAHCPKACREWEPGSRNCLMQRRYKGIGLEVR